MKENVLLAAVLGLSLSLFIVSNTNQTYAQNLSQSIAQMVLGESRCFQMLPPELDNATTVPLECATVVYESPKTIVVIGDYIIETVVNDQYTTYLNPIIWKVVDMLKTHGFSIDSINLSGQGNEGNPHQYNIVMSR